MKTYETAPQKQNTLTYLIRMAILVCVMALLGIGGYVYALWVSWDYNPHFLQAGTCLDNGGIWDETYQGGHCWYAGQCEDLDGFWYPAESRCVLEGTTTLDVL